MAEHGGAAPAVWQEQLLWNEAMERHLMEVGGVFGTPPTCLDCCFLWAFKDGQDSFVRCREAEVLFHKLVRRRKYEVLFHKLVRCREAEVLFHMGLSKDGQNRFVRCHEAEVLFHKLVRCREAEVLFHMGLSKDGQICKVS